MSKKPSRSPHSFVIRWDVLLLFVGLFFILLIYEVFHINFLVDRWLQSIDIRWVDEIIFILLFLSFGFIIILLHRRRMLIAAKRELEASREQFRILSEKSLLCVYIIRGDKFQYMNSAGAEIFGYSVDEIVGKLDVVDLCHPEDRKVVASNIRKRLDGKLEHVRYKFRGLRKDGSSIDCEAWGTRVELEGQVVILGTLLDITKEQAIQNALTKSEQMIRAIVDASPMGAQTYEAGAGGKFVLSFANQAADKILEIQHQNLIGQPFDRILPTLQETTVPEALREVLQTGQPRDLEIPYDDGRIKRVFEFYVIRISPLLVTMFFWDISTERRLKASEDKLREGEEQMRFILENVVDYIAVVDLEGNQVYNSPSYALMFGTPEELRGKSIFDQVHPDDRERIVGIFREAVASGETRLVEFRAVSQDGRTRILQAQGRIFKDGDGTASGAVVVSRDVTEKREFELERKLLYHAIEQSPSSIIITDAHGNIEYTNSKFTQITGYLSQEVLGKNPRVLKSGETSPAEYKQLWETIKSGKEWRGEFHNRKKDGNFFWEFASISPITDSAGKITHFVAVKEDITERRALEAQLFRTQRLESLGTLAGGIAHDLNNVLSPILLAIEMLRKYHQDEKSQHILSTLESSAIRGKNIIQQVLTFARGAEGTKAPMDVKHIIKEIQHISEETFPRNIHLQTSLPNGLWLVAGDLTQLHQVVMNLCVNARDAMPDGGILTIAAENMTLDEHYVQMHSEARVGPYVVVTITDTGIGIPRDIIDKIFDPFFSTKELGKGTGLGLSTVHSIVRGHRGFTNVYSEVGRGTTFKVFLPAIQTVETAQAGEEGPYPIGDQEVVLVVDDEASILEITRRTLESYGYRAMTASDGTEALAIYARNWDVIDLVLTDIMMPFVDGPALIRALRKIHPDVKIIGTSGLLDSGRIEEIGKLGLRAFLRKPYKADLLLRTIHSALDKKVA